MAEITLRPFMRSTMGNAAAAVKGLVERIFVARLSYFLRISKHDLWKTRIVSMSGISVRECVFSALGETVNAR
jgi:hypothetical protein